MKKILIILFINIFLIIAFLFILDFCAFATKSLKVGNNLSFINLKNYIISYKQAFCIYDISPKISKQNLKDIIYAEDNLPYRPVENEKAKKKFIIFGCSYAFGDSLQVNETFSYKLGKLTKYAVFNRAHCGRSAQHMLYQLENDDFYKLVPKPNYVIYLFVPWQVERVIKSLDPSIYYKKQKNNHLILDKYSLKYTHTFLTQEIINNVYEKLGYRDNDAEKNIDFFFLHIEQSLDAIKKHWGDDTKFIFFAYEDYSTNPYYLKHLEKLKEKGVIVIRLNDLSKKNFIKPDYQISDDDTHPNAKAWEEITPLFVKYLQNQGELK